MAEGMVDWHQKRTDLTLQLHDTPYSILRYLQRARCYEALQYPDLAAGDAYKALMLLDESDGGEFEDEVRDAFEIQGQDVGWHDVVPKPFEGVTLSEKVHKSQLMAEVYLILGKNLASCGDVEAALRFARQGIKIASMHKSLDGLYRELFIDETANMSGMEAGKPQQYARKTTAAKPCVRRELYRWNNHEPDRFSAHSLAFLNDEMRKYAPKCEVVATQLPILSESNSLSPDSKPYISSQSKITQLGIVAKEIIAPGEVLLLEPSILTASSRQLEPLCDACSAALPKLSSGINISCPSCSDIYFCSEVCQQRALELYHPAVCGFDDYDAVAKDPPPDAVTDSLYVLLVARAFAMAETQDLHPLDLAHTKYLWGDFNHKTDSSNCSLPFRFDVNIAQPLQILMNLEIDIYAPRNLDRYDIWVLNTLFAKFRGVASAKLNPHTLRPDVAAVHPLWCLANHSCAPNVRWEWGAEDGVFQGEEKGAMGFAARKENEIVQWGSQDRNAGIQKGQELLNHYCDVGMNVRERREWAIGALGGVCVCDRCLWEAGEPPLSNSLTGG